MICIWRKKNSGPPAGGGPPGPQRGPGALGEQMINKLLGKNGRQNKSIKPSAVIVDIEKWNLGVG